MTFNPLIISIICFISYIVIYKTLGTFIAKKIFKSRSSNPVPSKILADEKEYVASSKQVMFGHHFTSIAGTGPIVGPAIGVIWGWLPALLWVFFGSIFMGAIHDFSALMISIRHQGKSISSISGDIINDRVRLLFYCIVSLALLIVIAIFGMIIALIFDQFPSSVIAVWIEIPIAILFGYIGLRKHSAVLLKTTLAVLLLYIFIWIGYKVPLTMPELFGLPKTGLWTIILLSYAFIASILPVQVLLQPRDYLNAWQLYISLAAIIAGLVVTGVSGSLQFAAPAINLNPIGAPPIWPFLFITIACGAISGFHCLVCSGTSSKQIASEEDAQFVGYGSMLAEGALAIVVIVAVTAGIGIAYPVESGVLTGTDAFQVHYASWQASSGLSSKLSAVVIGMANMMEAIGIPLVVGSTIVGVFIASFAGTTLDSATRVQRYVIAELGEQFNVSWLTNKWIATAIAVISALALAFSSGFNGKGALLLWPLFGALNQLLGGLALLVATVYLKKRVGTWSLLTGLPCIFIMIMTFWASIINQIDFIHSMNWILAAINGLVILMTILILNEIKNTLLTSPND